ncbi:TauD/TfdA family dioxygenase [Bordetella genomosp. 8]|nr:TauD/TfdA family dioxygenase [Bordetella genomosp. 8]
MTTAATIHPAEPTASHPPSHRAPPPAVAPATGAHVWLGPQLASQTDWIDHFTAAEIKELLSALAQAKARFGDFQEVRRQDFDAPGLQARFRAVRRQLEQGRGFMMLRGLPLDDLSDADCKLLFWGIGMQLGVPLCQSARGELLAEVKDVGEKMGQSTSRAYRAAGPLRFHTDQCDVLGLMCIREPLSGGHSRIASSPALHNELLRTRPDLLATLRQDFHFSRQGEAVAGEQAWYTRPIFAGEGDAFTSVFSQSHIESAQKLDGVPRLTEAQREAVQTVARLADQHSLTVELRRGDLQFFNNHVIYHSRTDYQDHAEADRKRTLLRLWLAVPDSRRLPDAFAPFYGSTAPGALRGGILHASGRRYAFPDWEAAGWTAADLAA